MIAKQHIYIAAFIGLISGVFGYGEYKYYTGKSDLKREMQAAYNEALVIMQNKNNQLVIEQKKLEESYTDEIFKLNENADVMLDNVRTRTKRVYIKTRENCHLSKDDADSKDATRQSRSEVSQDVAKRLISRRKEADELVIRLNSCIDYITNNFKHINKGT